MIEFAAQSIAWAGDRLSRAEGSPRPAPVQPKGQVLHEKSAGVQRLARGDLACDQLAPLARRGQDRTMKVSVYNDRRPRS